MPFKTDWIAGEDEHPAEHNAIAGVLNHAFYPCKEGDIQAAIDAAIDRQTKETVSINGRPYCVVRIDPGVHTLVAPLRVYGINDLILDGRGALLQAGANLDTVVDLCGVNRCQFYGLTIDIPEQFVAERALWYRTDLQIAPMRSSHNQFYSTKVTGNFITGIECGDGGNTQTDTVDFYGTQVSGTFAHGRESINQRGVWCHGSGNVTEHRFWGLSCTANQVHIESQTDSLFYGCNFSTSEIDIKSRAHFLSVAGVRSENSRRFWDASGGATFPVSASFRDVSWHGDGMQAGDRWAQIDLGGAVVFESVVLRGLTAQPVFYSHPARPLTITINGLIAAGSNFEMSEFFDLSTTVTPLLNGWSVADASMGITETQPGPLLRSPNGTFYRVAVGADGTLTTEEV